jgi:hypothetical protein
MSTNSPDRDERAALAPLALMASGILAVCLGGWATIAWGLGLEHRLMRVAIGLLSIMSLQCVVCLAYWRRARRPR